MSHVTLKELAESSWASELAAAPRELFIPRVARASPQWGAPAVWIDRDTDPEEWASLVSADTSIVTQFDDGARPLLPTEGFPGVPTSSSSAPNLVFRMLRLLDPHQGHRVLEIGTGTGWTAGLLSARVGSDHVTTMEVDEEVAKLARANLEKAGFTPTLVVRDGAEGHPAGAPFDRIHVTCGIQEVPYAWIRQTRPGGTIVFPWMPSDRPGQLTVLTASDGSAVGKFHHSTGFMMMRAQRPIQTEIPNDTRTSVSSIDLRWIDNSSPGLDAALAGRMPLVKFGGGISRPDGSYRLSLRDQVTGSHALATQTDGSETQIEESGPRNLWRELESAYDAWLGWGRPEIERFGLEVTADGQYVWLDTPQNRIKDEKG